MTVAVKNGKDILQVVQAAITRHGATREELIPILTDVNHELGYIPPEAFDEISPHEIAQARARIASTGKDPSALSDDDIRARMAERARKFLEEAPTTAAQAATIILDGVKADRWRILVGADAERIDQRVREAPERAYDRDFFESFAKEVGWRVGG